MKVNRTKLQGVFVIEPDVFADPRGFFLETWAHRRYSEAGLPSIFVQDNLSRSAQGILRGLHLQHPYGQGKLVHVEYTTIAGSHCGFHFDSVDKFEIDHVTDDTNSYGTMLYGSGAGPNTISYSNFTNGTKDLDAQGTNGPIKVDHVHTGGKDSFQGVVPTITNKEASPVPNAKPR